MIDRAAKRSFLCMDVSVGKAWDGMADTLVRSGRYASATEVVEAGLRLVGEQERKLDRLRAKLQKAIHEAGSRTDGEVGAVLDAEEERLKAEGLRHWRDCVVRQRLGRIRSRS
jgi:antitoxin ParD1/3/4